MVVYQVQDRGIYHGLPVYDPEIKNLTAIVTGANGISGHYMVRVLAENPERWSKIYCLSRRPPAIPGGLHKNAEHIPLDFLQKPEEIASVLKKHGVTALVNIILRHESCTDATQRLCLLFLLYSGGAQRRPSVVVQRRRYVQGEQ